MSAVRKITFRCVFLDDTKVNVTVDNINPNSSAYTLAQVKQRVKTFNNTQGGELTNKMVSINGFNWVSIDRCTIVTTDREYIF